MQVGLSALRQLDVVDVARGPMENMQVEIPLAVYLSIWGNMGPTIILKLDGRFQSPMSVRVGYVSPLLSSATGAVYLTFMPEHEIEKVLAREIRELGDREADVDVDPGASEAAWRRCLDRPDERGLCGGVRAGSQSR